MKPCNGIIGRIFGHKFISELTEYNPSPRGTINYKGDLSELATYIQSQANKKYTIICLRCGKTPKEVSK